MVAGCSEHPATLISRRRSLSAEILHSSDLSNVIHKQPLLLESEGTRSREHSRCARTLRFLQQYRHSNVFPLSIFPIKQKTAFSGFESVRIILETRNIVRLKCGDPRLETWRDLDSKAPDWNGGASIPAKATRAFLFLNRRTSPISAIRAGPVTGPAPSICITISYSGSSAASRYISSCVLCLASQTAFKLLQACPIRVFVLSHLGRVATHSCAII